MDFTIEFSEVSRNEQLSLYLLTDDAYESAEQLEEAALDFLIANYDKYEICELVDQNDLAVAAHFNYRAAVVFHVNRELDL